MEAGARSKAYDVAVLRKALDVLALVASGTPLGVTELSSLAGISKPSAFRILNTLEGREYVQKDAESRKYRPGPALITLSGSVLSNLDLVRQARPSLERLHADFGETVNLGVAAGAHITYVDMIESRQGLRTAAHVGSRDLVYSTALGKAILAMLDADVARELFGREVPVRRTPHTIVTWEEFERELETVRACGYAIDREENELGSQCVAAPVRDASGRPVAAVSVSGPTSRVEGQVLTRIGEALRTEAAAIERQLGRVPDADRVASVD